MSTKKTQQLDRSFPVGSQVYFLFGRRRMKGFVVEDRGAIGVGGRRLLRIEAPLDSEDPLVLELPDEQLQPA